MWRKISCSLTPEGYTGYMTKNPFLNAATAALYIIIVATIMYYGIEHADGMPGIVIPVVVISLFTLSAGVMGSLFLFEPLQMYFDGAKKPAAKLFLETLAIFAGVTLLLFIALFLSV